MLTNPETYKLWNKASRHHIKAEELLKDNKFEDSIVEAILSLLSGYLAIVALSKELEMPDLSVMADYALLEWFEKSLSEHYTRDQAIAWLSMALRGKLNAAEKNYRPEEIIEWVHKTLKQLSEDLPPDTLPPFRG